MRHFSSYQAVERMSGGFDLIYPHCPFPTYSAVDISELLLVNPVSVGIAAVKLGLKTQEFGAYFRVKTPTANFDSKQFRYYDNAVEKLKDYFLAYDRL